ncbi:MAG TPA: leucine-rich repeat domain-containing protein [Verrucomicrobiota bacterium]|nr:leucine-rich repeat domain-containing protein [Verrucomicrobiota bacterium]
MLPLLLMLATTMGNAADTPHYYYELDGLTATITHFGFITKGRRRPYTGPVIDITIPDTFKRRTTVAIGDGAFYGCSSLRRVIIPNGVITVGHRAFSRCVLLTDVLIPESITRIANSAFDGCPNLTSITVSTGNPVFSSLDGVLLNKEQTVLVRCLAQKRGCYSIPAGVTHIAEHAFRDCAHLTEILLPNGLSSVGDRAFLGCASLTRVTIPASVTNLGSYVFARCHSLTNITVSSSNHVFSSYDGVLLDKDCTTLLLVPAHKQGECALPSSVRSIQSGAFDNCVYLEMVSGPEPLIDIVRQLLPDWMVYESDFLDWDPDAPGGGATRRRFEAKPFEDAPPVASIGFRFESLDQAGNVDRSQRQIWGVSKGGKAVDFVAPIVIATDHVTGKRDIAGYPPVVSEAVNVGAHRENSVDYRKLIRSVDAKDRVAAISALGAMGSKAAIYVSDMVLLLDDRTKVIRRGRGEIALRAESEAMPENGSVESLGTAVREMLTGIGLAAVPSLIEALESKASVNATKVAAVLNAITQEKLNENPRTWRQWWVMSNVYWDWHAEEALRTLERGGESR